MDNGKDDNPGVTPLPKADPESLVLRARPARAIRFKRGAVVALAAVASVSVIATAWVALKPTALQSSATATILLRPQRHRATR